MNVIFDFFATAAKGLEPVVVDELQLIGAENTKITQGGVYFSGHLETAYQLCLWSRVANRVLLKIAQFPLENPEQLYRELFGIDWTEHFDLHNTFAIDFVGRHATIRHSKFGAQKCKDAICDRFVEATKQRPNVDTTNPQIRINVHLAKGITTVALDLSGNSLHQRGYRLRSVEAPLRETVAAAVLHRARWPQLAKQGTTLVDPMCGSGTILIEAAMMAGDIAPGLLRTSYGFKYWKQHDEHCWQSLLAQAQLRREQGLKSIPPIVGYDRSSNAIQIAQENIRRADLANYIRVSQKEIRQLHLEEFPDDGLIVTNPPYGERLGRNEDLNALYQLLGTQLKSHFPHWKASVLTNQTELGQQIGLRARHINKLYNGPIECLLLHFDIEPRWFLESKHEKTGNAPWAKQQLGSGAQMFANRLNKNHKHLSRWAKSEKIDCYRVYDADLPEYALAVDLYQGKKLWICAQEYTAPKSIDKKKAQQRLQEALIAIRQTFSISEQQLFLKNRQRQKHKSQYEKLADEKQFEIVREANCLFYVNFTDYLDTGLFLDHRLTRMRIQQLAANKHVLNLFAYTGTASVHAAMGGASSTTSVDMSNTYLAWAKRNFKLNDIPLRNHTFIQVDCLIWLEQHSDDKFDLIFLDPPTFSTSKRMEQSLDVQRDHSFLITQSLKRLNKNGILIFSTNFRNFRLDSKLEKLFSVKDISAKTIPKDFARNPKIHRCWEITKKDPPTVWNKTS